MTVFINHRLPSFCYQMTKAILAMIAIDTTEKDVSIEYRRQDLIRNLRNDTLLQNRFIEQLRYFHYGKKSMAIRILDSGKATLSGADTDLMLEIRALRKENKKLKQELKLLGDKDLSHIRNERNLLTAGKKKVSTAYLD